MVKCYMHKFVFVTTLGTHSISIVVTNMCDEHLRSLNRLFLSKICYTLTNEQASYQYRFQLAKEVIGKMEELLVSQSLVDMLSLLKEVKRDLIVEEMAGQVEVVTVVELEDLMEVMVEMDTTQEVQVRQLHCPQYQD